jgi:hypothetical protein
MHDGLGLTLILTPTLQRGVAYSVFLKVPKERPCVDGGESI